MIPNPTGEPLYLSGGSLGLLCRDVVLGNLGIWVVWQMSKRQTSGVELRVRPWEVRIGGKGARLSVKGNTDIKETN